MSKILLLADTHYGVRKNNVNFYQYQRKFLHKVFFPYIEKYSPDAIVHLGDLVDNRTAIEYRSYDRMVSDFLDPMKEYEDKIPHYWIAGNHDSYYKNSLDINAIRHFVKSGEVVDTPRNITIGNESFCFIPWICDANREQSLEVAQTSTAHHCFGHLELKGFEVRRGTICHEGFDRNIFGNFDTTFSGHFHNRSHGNNIRYIASCFQFDWSDAGEYRGMAVLDTETGRVQYFRNPYSMFNIFEYDGANVITPDTLAGTYVRVVVKHKASEADFDDFISKLEDIGLADLSVVDHSIKKIELTSEIISVDETKAVCDEYIAKAEIPNRDEVQTMFNEIYVRSLK